MFASPAGLCLLLALLCLRYSACAPTSDEFCGNDTLRKNQICCQDRVANVPDKSYRCCDVENGEVTTYNPATHNCPERKVINLKKLPFTIRKSPPYIPPECGGYNPRNATCCKGIIHQNMPSSDTDCCLERPYLKNDENNPCKGVCGEKKYNSEYQMCCGNKIYNITDPDMTCCNNREPVRKSDGLFCCNDLNVYRKATMTCDENSGRVRFKSFNPAVLCTLEAEEQASTFDDYLGITITGVVESCNVKSRGGDLIIPLSPFSVTSNGLPVDRRPLGDENVFKVRVRFDKNPRECVHVLKRSLKTKALVIQTTDTSFLSRKKPQLLIQRGNRSFVFLRKYKLDSILE